MKSHTVPFKLLDQFAFDDPKTSRRLWRYEKGRAPRGDASPRTATRIPKHFSDPKDSVREEEIETRLNIEFENTVHNFIDQLRYRTFVLSRQHVRQLTRYVSLLFHRSQARKKATRQLIDVVIESIRALMGDEHELSQIAGKWTIELIAGDPSSASVTIDQVRASAQEMIDQLETMDHEQTTYVDSMERAMAHLDEELDAGQWEIISNDSDMPFVIGDAPIVTWERLENNILAYGMGFSRPNVEVILPVAPTACLHMLPAVQRSRPTRIPTVQEVNQAQASFCVAHCYTDRNEPELDRLLQPVFGQSSLGINVFSVRHRDYSNTMFELLMSGGRNFVAPRV